MERFDFYLTKCEMFRRDSGRTQYKCHGTALFSCGSKIVSNGLATTKSRLHCERDARDNFAIKLCLHQRLRILVADRLRNATPNHSRGFEFSPSPILIFRQTAIIRRAIGIFSRDHRSYSGNMGFMAAGSRLSESPSRLCHLHSLPEFLHARISRALLRRLVGLPMPCILGTGFLLFTLMLPTG